MTTTTSAPADFVQFLESTEDPGNLFAHDLFCDFNVPRWRYQLQGVPELAQEIRHEGPNHSQRALHRAHRLDTTLAGRAFQLKRPIYGPSNRETPVAFCCPSSPAPSVWPSFRRCRAGHPPLTIRSAAEAP